VQPADVPLAGCSNVQLQVVLCAFLFLSVAIAANGLQLASPGADGVQGLQTLTMANAGSTQPGTTILQYAQTSDGQQILVPSNQVVVQSEYAFWKRLGIPHR